MSRAIHFLAFLMLVILIAFPTNPSERARDYMIRLYESTELHVLHPALIVGKIVDGLDSVTGYVWQISDKWDFKKKTFETQKNNYKRNTKEHPSKRSVSNF